MPPSMVHNISEEIGSLEADRRVTNRWGHVNSKWLTKWAAWMITLGTAYHKIVPMCQQADPIFARGLQDDWQCTDTPLPAEPDGKIVYDFVPVDKERGYCYGELCTLAARAIDALRAFLHAFSQFRTEVVHAMISNKCPFRSDGKFLRILKQMAADLPGVIASLRLAEPGLAVACVAPSRSNARMLTGNWEDAKRMLVFQKRATSSSNLVDGNATNEELLKRVIFTAARWPVA